jgi:hypothetical protein
MGVSGTFIPLSLVSPQNYLLYNLHEDLIVALSSAAITFSNTHYSIFVYFIYRDDAYSPNFVIIFYFYYTKLLNETLLRNLLTP